MKSGQPHKTKIVRVANVLILIGLILVAIPAGLWVNAKYYQWNQSKKWEPLTIAHKNNHKVRKMRTAKNSLINTADLVDGSLIKSGDSIAYLEIPALNLKQTVLEDATWANLARGPVHVSKTAKIGDVGTALISAHRTMYGAPFHNLDSLKAGDKLILYTKKAVFTYTVIEIKKIKPDDWSDIKPDGEPRLVLSTCNPMYSAAQRLLAISRLTGAEKL